MIQEPSDPLFAKHLERAEKFLLYYGQSEKVYHNHKETMAYLSVALFVSVFGAAFVSDNFPPEWVVKGSTFVKIVIIPLLICFIFILYLIYLHWQLFWRGYSAIRVQTAEDIIVRWTCLPATLSDLEPIHHDQRKHEYPTFWQFIWPSYGKYIIENTTMKVAPKIYIDTLKETVKEGSPARIHERLLYTVSWFIFFAVFIKTAICGFSSS